MLSMFLNFFLRLLLEDVILKKTNEALREKEEKEIPFGKFLRYLAILLFMATLSGFKVSDFWSSKEVKLWSGVPYCFNQWMVHKRFSQ